MGKKVKIGKQRRDKFYHFAKETGYRSRAAFKLLQLNQKYNFLNKSRICVDLCAAPGGWMQVAAKQMPLSSVVIGFDLFPIKSIPNTSSYVCDITSSKCRSILKKDLNDWKVDVFLHDGAPNVGQNWLYDAYQQNLLTLSAFQLAIEFLRPGGWFVTKIFRSKDYFNLIWVMQKLFKKVHATKPEASRMESAEIFVVCEDFIAPKKIDGRFTDPKFVFKELDDDEKEEGEEELDDDKSDKLSSKELRVATDKKFNLLFPKKELKNRSGYADQKLRRTMRLSQFFSTKSPIEALANNYAIISSNEEDEQIREKATKEIQDNLGDLRSCSRSSLKAILKWRTKLLEDTDRLEKDKMYDLIPKKSKTKEDELKEMDDHIKEQMLEEKREAKQKKRRIEKMEKKLMERLALKLDQADDHIDMTQEDNIFSLKRLKPNAYEEFLRTSINSNEKTIDKILDRKIQVRQRRIEQMMRNDSNKSINTKLREIELYGNVLGSTLPSIEDDFHDTDDDEDDLKKKKFIYVDRDVPIENNPIYDQYLLEEKRQDNDDVNNENYKKKKNMKNNEESMGEMKENDKKSLVIDEKEMDDWYESKEIQVNSDEEEKDLDSEEEEFMKNLKTKKNEKIKEETKKKKKKRQSKKKQKSQDHNDDDDDDEGSDEDIVDTYRRQAKEEKEKQQKNHLDAESLALATQMLRSKSDREQILDNNWNRFMDFGLTDNLPNWYVQDEKKHCKIQLPIDKNLVRMFKEKMKEIDARPLKKVLQAKVRKRRRLVRKLEKASKKADAVDENLAIADTEKMRKIKDIYKKANLLKKKKRDVKYVVSKKGNHGGATKKKMRGPYRIVDPREKKDKRSVNSKISRGITTAKQAMKKRNKKRHR
ncbi:hypothetical protein SNEBB_002478 [Seison nebaliae]|nr:hypothetical protein SNEBB_002478 [Seison nebaliae]